MQHRAPPARRGAATPAVVCRAARRRRVPRPGSCIFTLRRREHIDGLAVSRVMTQGLCAPATFDDCGRERRRGCAGGARRVLGSLVCIAQDVGALASRPPPERFGRCLLAPYRERPRGEDGRVVLCSINLRASHSRCSLSRRRDSADPRRAVLFVWFLFDPRAFDRVAGISCIGHGRIYTEKKRRKKTESGILFP